jgi:hypothetical protein
MKNMESHTIEFIKTVRVIIESKPADLSNELRTLAWGYSGDENRFIRQDIINELSGEKHILAKCGVRALAMQTEMYIARLAVEANATAPAPEVSAPAPEPSAPAPEPSAPAIEQEGIAGIDYEMPGAITEAKTISQAKPTATIGLQVIRKQCQRKGEVTAIEGQHVTVTLEDGSKRKPCMSRFQKLYSEA